MKSVIANEIQQDAVLGPAVAKANELLSAIVGFVGKDASATWAAENDLARNRIVSLSLSEWPSSVAARFTPEDFTQPYQPYSRLRRLWRELLKVRSKDLISRVLEEIGETGSTPNAPEN